MAPVSDTVLPVPTAALANVAVAPVSVTVSPDTTPTAVRAFVPKVVAVVPSYGRLATVKLPPIVSGRAVTLPASPIDCVTV